VVAIATYFAFRWIDKVMVCFAVISILAIGFDSRWLPETKGLSVEEAVSVFEQQAGAKRAAA
jgi:hypothetical protein